MKRIMSIVLVIVVSFFLVGCRAATAVYNVSNQTITTNKQQVALEDVEKAIIRAGVGLGWVMTKAAPGEIKATLNLRAHVAIVSIKYSTKDYTINYVSSTNLEYNAANNTIHSNYNSWIKNLNQAIQVQLSSL